MPCEYGLIGVRFPQRKAMMRLRIHGDNILECEQALGIVAAALANEKPLTRGLADAPLWAPNWVLSSGEKKIEVQLFPGYGRWTFDIQKELRARGAPLREMVDAIVTELDEGSPPREHPILAIEFCGALPAGNQAWQRSGRALNAAYSKIPYLYFAELGGVELDSNRRIKAGRLPNPLVPFAYLALGDALSTIALPVFQPSPSIQDRAKEAFAGTFGKEDAVTLVRSILEHNLDIEELRKLRARAVSASGTLAQLRHHRDTLTQNEWAELADERSGASKADWLISRKMEWKKTVTIPVTVSFRSFLSSVQKIAVAIGTEELPICLVSGPNRTHLAQLIAKIYGRRIGKEFLVWIQQDTKPIALVWIAGFKPRGDDSRPDRGLVPLARMIFGENDIDVLSIVYGPARNLSSVFTNPSRAAETNGLWEAILRFSNGLIVDSRNGKALKEITLVVPFAVQARPSVISASPAGGSTPLEFGENDVDTALHLIFASGLASTCFECMCNPPGGDWSGLSVRVGTEIFRWTGLPRVTPKDEKRPDHVILFPSPDSRLLAIESKNKATDVEAGIGPRLVRYVSTIMRQAPNIVRTAKGWEPLAHLKPIAVPPTISAAAFQYRKPIELNHVGRRAGCDLILGFEFQPSSGRTIIHVKANRKLDWLLTLLDKAAVNLGRKLIIQED